MFTYRVPDHLAPRVTRGAYVRIPFRGQKVWGIVQRCPSTIRVPGTRLRDVLDARTDVTLTNVEVEVLERAAALYRTSIATVALHAVPLPPLRTQNERCPKSDLGHQAHENTARNVLLRSGLTIAIWDEHQQRDAALRSIARAVTARGQSLLCCTPHRANITALAHIIAPVAPVIVIDRTATRGNAWAAAVASRTTPAVLLGTRAAIWSAPPTLGAIVMDHAESDDHVSWDADPQYDARTVGQWIARERGTPLILMSPAPRAVDWARADYRVDLGDHPQRSPTLSVGETAPSCSVVDLRQHWRSGARGYLTAEALDAIEASLAAQRVTVILHNRRGLAARITCADCSGTIMCTECGVPYAEHPDGLRCHRCGRTVPTPPTCPACRSPRLSSRGIGTAGIAHALAREYANIPIARIDRDAPAPPPPNARVIVGTERFLHAIAPNFTRAVGAIIIIDAARFVRSDDYRATERLFQALRNVLAWSRTWGARCIIQSTVPDLPALTALQQPIASFYRSELAEREALRYPPATRLIRCTMEEADDLTPIRNRANVERIDGPFPARRRPHSASSYTAIIRLRGDVSDDDVVSVLRALPPTIHATVDPISLTE
ncbi:hypothetical protein HY635_00635 [Candidatus Uhrbacteria bacterium]|nr:hypothetical protein [Candidatus Uhrbacteria bacterium]